MGIVGEERRGKETDGCPLTSQAISVNLDSDSDCEYLGGEENKIRNRNWKRGEQLRMLHSLETHRGLVQESCSLVL
jgi:hypothetical protein